MISVEITEIVRPILRDLLSQCTPGQVEKFHRIYGSVDDVPLNKLQWAINSCERTIAKNKKEGVQ